MLLFVAREAKDSSPVFPIACEDVEKKSITMFGFSMKRDGNDRFLRFPRDRDDSMVR
jgi:hypothetical protein